MTGIGLEMGNIKQLFYKTAGDFAAQYDINEEIIIEILTDTQLGADHPKADIVGMTEMNLLKKLDLWITIEGYEESKDPRNLVYIIYNTIQYYYCQPSADIQISYLYSLNRSIIFTSTKLFMERQ